MTSSDLAICFMCQRIHFKINLGKYLQISLVCQRYISDHFCSFITCIFRSFSPRIVIFRLLCRYIRVASVRTCCHVVKTVSHQIISGNVSIFKSSLKSISGHFFQRMYVHITVGSFRRWTYFEITCRRIYLQIILLENVFSNQSTFRLIYHRLHLPLKFNYNLNLRHHLIRASYNLATT